MCRNLRKVTSSIPQQKQHTQKTLLRSLSKPYQSLELTQESPREHSILDLLHCSTGAGADCQQHASSSTPSYFLQQQQRNFTSLNNAAPSLWNFLAYCYQSLTQWEHPLPPPPPQPLLYPTSKEQLLPNSTLILGIAYFLLPSRWVRG